MTRPAFRSAGFTLIELLIVIAVLAILTALGIYNFGRWRATSAVVQGTQEFTQAVRNARSGAKRANACWQLSLVAFTTANTQYQVKEYSGPTCPASTTTLLRTSTYTVPANTQLVHVNGSGTVVTTASNINFVPPYGTTDSTADNYQVQWAPDPTIRRTVRVTGIFGKVVIK